MIKGLIGLFPIFGIIGFDRGGDHGWRSRDTKHIDCRATACNFNMSGHCAVPTRCVINETGGCDGFEAKPLRIQIDGD
jgi:hypothetical protein